MSRGSFMIDTAPLSLRSRKFQTGHRTGAKIQKDHPRGYKTMSRGSLMIRHNSRNYQNIKKQDCQEQDLEGSTRDAKIRN